MWFWRLPPATAPIAGVGMFPHRSAPHDRCRHGALPWPPASGRFRRGDVAVDAEEVVRVVPLFDVETVVVGAVGSPGPVGVLVSRLEVDAVAAGGEGLDPLPRIRIHCRT